MNMSAARLSLRRLFVTVDPLRAVDVPVTVIRLQASLDIGFGKCLSGLSRVQSLTRPHVTCGKISDSFASLKYVRLLDPSAGWYQGIGNVSWA
jgi:hypothetical protein